MPPIPLMSLCIFSAIKRNIKYRSRELFNTNFKLNTKQCALQILRCSLWYPIIDAVNRCGVSQATRFRFHAQRLPVLSISWTNKRRCCVVSTPASYLVAVVCEFGRETGYSVWPSLFSSDFPAKFRERTLN